MRLRTIAILAVLILASPAAPASATPYPAEEIQVLLDRMAGAVRAKDKTQFLAALDDADHDFVARQTAWFEGMSLLPVKDFVLELELLQAPEFTRQRDRDKYKVPVMVAAVEARFRLDGYDPRPAILDHVFTFVYRTDRWLVATDSGLEDLGIITDHSLWEFGAIELKKSEHFLFIYHPAQAAFADELVAAAEASLAAVSQAWKPNWNMQIPVFVPSNQTEVTKMIGDIFDVSYFVAFASASLDRETESGWELVGNRVTINPSRFLAGSQATRQDIFSHELVHIATRGASGPFVPTFVEEGIAQISERRSLNVLNRRIRSGKFDRRLPEDFEFLTGNASDIFNSYQEAFSAMSFMKQTFGIDKLDAFYQALGKPRIEPGTSRYHTNLALTQTLGISLVDFESRWANFAASSAR
ncbi:MAG: hypothetical protein ABIS18_06790 [Actinomycetota bacterium]